MVQPPLCAQDGKPDLTGFARVDWQAPWLAPIAQAGQAVWVDWTAHGGALCDSLNRHLSAPVAFVRQDALGVQMPYEAHVARLGQVPTRDNVHDFFNALIWSAWPETKSQINRLHAAEIAAQTGAAGPRGATRDGLTLLDENGAALVAPTELWRALEAHDWHTAFVAKRALWAQSYLWLFGHALLEQLAQPRKGLTAHVWLMDSATNQWAIDALASGQDICSLQRALDKRWSKTLTAKSVAAKPFTPLPVLGVPHWWAANEEADFYADSSVFRPPRQRRRPASS